MVSRVDQKKQRKKHTFVKKNVITHAPLSYHPRNARLHIINLGRIAGSMLCVAHGPSNNLSTNLGRGMPALHAQMRATQRRSAGDPVKAYFREANQEHASCSTTSRLHIPYVNYHDLLSMAQQLLVPSTTALRLTYKGSKRQLTAFLVLQRLQPRKTEYTFESVPLMLLLYNSFDPSRVLCVRHTTHSALICSCVWYIGYAGGLPGLDYFPSARSLEPLLCLRKPVPSISSLRDSCGAGASNKFVEKWPTRVLHLAYFDLQHQRTCPQHINTRRCGKKRGAQKLGHMVIPE